ncbi:MAG TPA: hypothetical protein ENK55_10860 [Actinobacteria bacterium]|nr:hypothetical protein [Actinomycetota bacterium]
MIIDCGSCAMEHTPVCDDCVVTALLEGAAGPLRLAEEEAEALAHLAEEGLVAPLRLVPVRRRGAATG